MKNVVWKKSLALALGAVLVTGTALTGCGSTSGITESAATDESGIEGETYKVTYIASSMSDAFGAWLANTTVEIAEEKYPNLKITVVDQQNDTTKGPELLENALNSGVDGIIYHKTGDADTSNYLKEAKEDGIPVVQVNLPVDNDEDASSVLCDEYQLGYLIGQTAAEELPENANVVILNGYPGHNPTINRREGFEDGLFKTRTDVTLLDEQTANWSKDEAMQKMDDWLQVYDRIDGVLAENDSMALGAYESAKANGYDLDTIKFYGVDGLADACLAIKAGEETASALQDANTMAELALDILVQNLENGSVECVHKEFAPTLINAENVDEWIEVHKENGLIKE